MTNLEHKVTVSQPVHYVPMGGQNAVRTVAGNKCAAAVVSGLGAGPNNQVILTVFEYLTTESKSQLRSSVGAEYSTEGYRGSYHLPEDCPFPPQKPEDPEADVAVSL